MVTRQDKGKGGLALGVVNYRKFYRKYVKESNGKYKLFWQDFFVEIHLSNHTPYLVLRMFFSSRYREGACLMGNVCLAFR